MFAGHHVFMDGKIEAARTEHRNKFEERVLEEITLTDSRAAAAMSTLSGTMLRFGDQVRELEKIAWPRH
jgi:hypothetical protein